MEWSLETIEKVYKKAVIPLYKNGNIVLNANNNKTDNYVLQ